MTLNALGLYAVALVLAAAFAAQLLLDELPCPLCLLQRIQFALLAVGPVLDVQFGPRPVATRRQAARRRCRRGLRFAPDPAAHHAGEPGYRSALLGYHYYTWAFIGFAAAIVLIAGMLLFDRQFEDGGGAPPVAAGAFARTGVWLVIGLTAANVVSDPARMRVCRLSGRSRRLRVAQAHAVSALWSLDRLLALGTNSLRRHSGARALAREPGIHNLRTARVVYYVYILASRKHGTLYIGLTNNLVRRVYQHKTHAAREFTSRYGIHLLVWFECYDDVLNAIAREKGLGITSQMEDQLDREV